jgi:hypothetical protein
MGTQIESRIAISYVGNGVSAAEPCDSRPDLDQCKWKNGATDQSAEMTKMLQSLVNGLNIILGFITLAVSPAILFAGWLMSPDWTSGDLFGLRAPMYALWVTVSNIVYFVYAVMLILIALGTMFGNDKFSYKVMLPKLALGILMVPFTWWFVQWTISISAVVTASVMTIPMETISTSDVWWMGQPSIPRNITIQEGSDAGNKDKTECNEITCIKPIDFLGQQSGMYGQMMVYAYSIFKFDQVKDLSKKWDQAKSIVDLVHQWLVGAIMFIVFGLLTLALVSILLVRAIKLWAYAIFAPLFTFQFVAGSVGSDKDMFSIKEFIGLCFVPAIVWLTLSFGLIIISAVSNSKTSGSSTPCNVEALEKSWCDIAKLMGSDKNKITRKVQKVEWSNSWTTTNTIQWGDVKINFIGKAGASQGPEAAAETVDQMTGVLDSAGGIFGTLIIDIIALVFIWLAFMAAKVVNKAVASAIEPFEKIGSQVGGLAKSIPKYTPIPGTGMSASTLWKTVELSQQKFESKMRSRDEEKIGSLFPGLVEWSIKEVERLKAENKLKSQTNNYSGIQETLWTLATGAKATQSNIDSIQKTITQASVDRAKFDDSIRLDNLDDKTKAAARKFAKNESLDTKEIELVMKWLQSKGSAPNGGAGASGITANQVWTGNNYAITINNKTLDADINTGTVNVTDEFKKNIADKSLGKSEDFKKKIIDGIAPKVGAEKAEKIATDLIKKIDKSKFE